MRQVQLTYRPDIATSTISSSTCLEAATKELFLAYGKISTCSTLSD
ncbi:hypothetical protein EVA_21442 [gut metagenome]|uniref:Uncharacterized protein n=1 Tax=gut metagenome TaxID=749906 RepID=J9FLE7_9ZZZZ